MIQISTPDPVTSETDAGTPNDRPAIGRGALVGGSLGFLVVFVAVVIATTIAGFDTGGAVGVALFVGLFGGFGFGAMAGALVPVTRHFDAQPMPGLIGSVAPESK